MDATSSLSENWFANLVKNTRNVEYVKLIVSCLDYSSEDSFNRFILQTALTSASVAGRKWTTQFLTILLSHNINDFSIWGIKLLLGQLADSSAKLVRHALRILHRWIPHYPESIYLIKDICFDGFGDAGILLKTYLFSNEDYVKDNSHDTRATLEFWKKEFNVRYVEIIDEDVRAALLGSKRSIDGRYARSSNERIAKLGVPMPVHLYGQLAQHDTGRELLLQSNEVNRLLDVLRDSPLPTDTHHVSKLKGTLYALGHIVANQNPNHLPSETIPIICRFAECCPILSIRGAAFWILNLIGNTQPGSALLLSLGWESSNFIVSKKKSNTSLLKEAKMDISKIWIQCIDGKLPSQHLVNLKDKDRNEIISSVNTDNLDSIASRSKRNYAVDSAVANSMNSIAVDKLGFGVLRNGKINCSVRSGDVSWYTVFKSESHLLNHSNIDAVERVSVDFNRSCQGVGKTRDEMEDCLIIRSYFRLPPFSLNNPFETPTNYTTISSNKIFHCYDSCWSAMSSEIRPFHLRGQSISLPCSPDLFLKDIFVGDEFNEHICDSSLIKRKHRISDCFYCSWPEEYFGSKNISEIGVSSEARDEIISLFLLQGSKCSVNAKKLLQSYSFNREIFSSLCLYSDILVLLAQHDYSIEARRLAHELFTDALKKVSFGEANILKAR
ncbi:unnamed protein product [Litomosoides sigmodontis]|uniref:Rapamycin-insensitive companion of mTOR domain-containing protein n=1 Tax=Litomosoides sigmodontis TaxID=42156 RepID=A0A3P6T012_LITSI|nr:unnamed protein product [Litomosoides sigmodontis]